VFWWLSSEQRYFSRRKQKEEMDATKLTKAKEAAETDANAF